MAEPQDTFQSLSLEAEEKEEQTDDRPEASRGEGAPISDLLDLDSSAPAVLSGSAGAECGTDSHVAPSQDSVGPALLPEDSVGPALLSEDSVGPALLSEDSDEHGASVERSMEQTVSLPSSDIALSSLSPVDERDLVIKVSDHNLIPSTSFNSSSYVTYAVSTRTSRKVFDRTEYNVRRRYQDFIWLREQLEDTYKTHIVPPLPEKHSLSRIVQMDHFTPEFLSRRMGALSKFLNRLAEHPTISFDRTFMAFLIADEKEFEVAKSSRLGMLDKFSATVRQAVSGFVLKNPDPDFTSLQNYFSKLSQHLSQIEAAAFGALQDAQEIRSELLTLSDTCRKWSLMETVDRPMLDALADCFRTTSGVTASLDTELSLAFAPFHEYSLYCESAQEVLKRREALQMDHELAVEELLSKQGALGTAKTADTSKSLMSFFSSAEKVKADRIESAQASLALAQQASERTGDDLECANEHLRADMSRWQRVKKSDMANTFVNISEIHIAHLSKSLEMWQSLMSSLEDGGSGAA